MTANASGVDVDAVHVLANPLPPTPEEHRVMLGHVYVYGRDKTERHRLYQMLGLDAEPAELAGAPGPAPRAFPMLAHVPARATKGRRRKS